jgi:hypothetical protein
VPPPIKNPKIVACENCGTDVDLTGHVGRPPHYCSDECRRAGFADAARIRRAERRTELDRLRALVQQYEAAFAA